jgi:hypothetical protein
VSIQLEDSVITEAYAQSRNKEMAEELLLELGQSLVGTKPKYKFIDRFEYGSYSFVIDKEKL